MKLNCSSDEVIVNAGDIETELARIRDKQNQIIRDKAHKDSYSNTSS